MRAGFAARGFVKRNIIVANFAMWASSAVAANATWYGTGQCRLEDLRAGNPNFGRTAEAGGRFHPWRRSFAMSLPADGAISFASWLLHRKHHDLAATLLPSGSAGVQLGISSVLYAEGCI